MFWLFAKKPAMLILPDGNYRKGCYPGCHRQNYPALDTWLWQLVEFSFWGYIKIYAIIETGGKQYKVTSGQVIDVDYLDMAEGNTIELDRVLLIANEDNVTVGTPTIDGAKVIATSQGEGKGKKIIVFKYKPKVRYRKKTGHRQLYTRISIDKIIGPKPAKKVRKRKSEVKEKESGS